MKKTSVKLENDLIWNLKRDKPPELTLDQFIRYIHAYWRLNSLEYLKTPKNNIPQGSRELKRRT